MQAIVGIRYCASSRLKHITTYILVPIMFALLRTSLESRWMRRCGAYQIGFNGSYDLVYGVHFRTSRQSRRGAQRHACSCVPVYNKKAAEELRPSCGTREEDTLDFALPSCGTREEEVSASRAPEVVRSLPPIIRPEGGVEHFESDVLVSVNKERLIRHG